MKCRKGFERDKNSDKHGKIFKYSLKWSCFIFKNESKVAIIQIIKNTNI